MEYRYYLAGGESEQKVREFFKRRADIHDQIIALGKELGGTPIANGRTVSGFAFDECPDGWRKAGWTPKGGDYFLPVRRSKAGKELYKRIEAFRIPDAHEIHSMFSNDGGVWGEMSVRGGFPIYYITAEISKGKVIIHVPEKSDLEPPESKLLKNSEYWAIKEQAKETAAA